MQNSAKQTDEQLMIAYREGDRSAFDTLVRRHWSPVEEFLRRMLRDAALVDDVLIECFFKLHRSAPTYQPQARFTTFLFRIAYHEAIDTLRRLRRLQQTGAVPFGHPSGPELRVACARPDSEAHVLVREDIDALETLIDTLAETPRAVFLLFYREELSTVEIAQTLEMPVTSVRAYLSLTRKELRAAMAALEESPARTTARRR